MNYTDKYLPKKSEDVIGQDNAIKKIKDCLSNYKKALILYGPVGSGKTSSVYAIAEELNKEVFEVNASDVRNKKQIEEVVGMATQQESLLSFGKGKIILIDEIDGLSGTKDRGGITALIKLMKKSAFPMILTANDPFTKKFSSLRKKCELIEFNELSYESILTKLKDICEKEKIKYKEDVLRDLARREGGDMRAAITDLQLLSSDGKIDNLDLIGERNRTEKIKDALFKVFKTTDASIARTAFWSVNEDVDKQILWLEENLPKEYKGEDLANAFDCLSKADVYLGRIRRWQHWRFLVYANNMISSGVALSKKEKNKSIIEYKPTSKILKLWIAKMKYKKRKDIAGKIALKCHCSSKRALEILPYVQQMIKKGKEFGEFEFNKDEMEWLNK